VGVELYSDKSAGYFANARRQIEPLLPARIDRMLDIGCGSGATLAWLRSIRAPSFVAGVELSPEAAAAARGTADLVVTGDAETAPLPFDPGSFDLITALDVLEHMVDPWKALGRLHALLAPGGRIIASIPNVAHYSVVLPLLMRGQWAYQQEGLLDRTHLRFFVERTAVELMTSSGLAFEQMLRTEMLPAWLPGRRLPWYVHKAVAPTPLHRLIDYQFLIRVRRGPDPA
jgi:SAM-dependent methyltransferase